MIYGKGRSPYFRRDFGIGSVMFLPNHEGSPADHAVMARFDWDTAAEEADVDGCLGSLGIPGLQWFRRGLVDLSEAIIPGLPETHILHGYLDEATALGVKTDMEVYERAYGDRLG